MGRFWVGLSGFAHNRVGFCCFIFVFSPVPAEGTRPPKCRRHRAQALPHGTCRGTGTLETG